MAQTANFTPVVLEKDNSIQFAGQMIANAMKEKSIQQAAVKQAILKQRNANDAIFGAESKNIREYYDKSKSLAPAERDRILTEKMAMLARIPKDSPEYLRAATQVTNEASSAFSGINQTFADTEATIEEMKNSGSKLNPDAVRRFASTYMYDFSQANDAIIRGLEVGAIKPPNGRTREEAINDARLNGQVKTLKSPSQLQDFRTNLKAEISLHPELYADIGAVKQGALSDVNKFFSSAAKPAGSKLTLDLTGTKTTNIGTDYTITPFDILEETKDNDTGLKYSRPKLNTTSIKGLFYKGGDSVDVLGEEQYQLLLNNGGRALRDDLAITVPINMRDHNTEAFKRAGIPNPDKVALTVSNNNVSNFRNIPGFIDPFDEGQVEVFQRAAVVDLLKQSGRYDKDGYVDGFKLDRGVNKANPKAGVTVNIGGSGPNFVNGKIPAYDNLLAVLKAGEDPLKSTKIDNNTRQALLTIADENSILRSTGTKMPPSMLQIKIAPDGSVGLYKKSNGELITSISQQSFDMRVNEFSSKAEANAAAGGEGDPSKSNIKWK